MPSPVPRYTIAVALLLSGAGSLAGQDIGPSERGDSVLGPIDDVPGAHHGNPLPFILAMGGLVLAPPALFLFVEGSPGANALDVGDRTSVTIALGVSGRGPDGEEVWGAASSAELEVLHGPVHGIVWAERLNASDDSWLYGARVGPSWRPHRAIATSVLVGFSSGPSATHAEVGLPVIITTESATAVFEPSYWITSSSVEWRLRFDADFNAAPYLQPGVSIRLRGAPWRDEATVALSLSLAWRLW